MNIQYFTQLGVDAPHLIITKVCYIIIFIWILMWCLLHLQVDVSLQDKTLRPLIDNDTYRPSSSSDKLNPVDAISDVWPEQPPKDCLHIFVGLPALVGSPTLLPLPDKNAA